MTAPPPPHAARPASWWEAAFHRDPLAVCTAAARAGGQVLREWQGRFTASNKGPRDLVTEADLAAQREIKRILLDAFPDHGFIGEEAIAGDTPAAHADLRWIVDPLDGTTNYVHGFPAYCVSIGLARGDELLVGAIYDPVHDELFTARRGGGAACNGRPIKTAAKVDAAAALAAVSFPPQVTVDAEAVVDFLAVIPHVHAIRRTGSTAINLAYLACGRLDAFWVRRIACWDVAAGLLIAAEAGATVGSFGGNASTPVSMAHPSFVAACTPALYATLCGLLREGASGARAATRAGGAG